MLPSEGPLNSSGLRGRKLGSAQLKPYSFQCRIFRISVRLIFKATGEQVSVHANLCEHSLTDHVESSKSLLGQAEMIGRDLITESKTADTNW